MYKIKKVNGKRVIEAINVNKLVEIGKTSKYAFSRTVKELEGKAEFHPDAVEDIMQAIEELGWDEEEVYKDLIITSPVKKRQWISAV